MVLNIISAVRDSICLPAGLSQWGVDVEFAMDGNQRVGASSLRVIFSFMFDLRGLTFHLFLTAGCGEFANHLLHKLLTLHFPLFAVLLCVA